MSTSEIPLKDPQATPTYRTTEGVTVNEAKGGLVLVADPSVEGVWSFSSHEVARRVHRALDEWLRMSDSNAVRK